MEMFSEFTAQVSEKIMAEAKKVIINQDEAIQLSLVALFSDGHILLEGVPGLGKTLLVRTLSKIIDTGFNRVQFTPDLMPADIIGTKIFNLQNNSFEIKKGPLFTNLFLADEINRTPPKTQSGMLEVMEERSITIDGETFRLQEPFVVFATQNPVEYEGTYPLPEALTDRFMMKLLLHYPGREAEKSILHMYHSGFEAKKLEQSQVESVVTPQDLLQCKEEIKLVTIEEGILDYITQITEMSRKINVVSIGASPRGSVSLLLASKAFAAMQGRSFVIPEDVQVLAHPVLRHRIFLKPEAEIDGIKPDEVIEKILSQIKVPR